MKKAMLCLAMVAIVFSQGCCTIFRDGTDTLNIKSNPAGAKVEVGPYQGVAPCTLAIPRGKSFPVQASYMGRTKTQALDKGVDVLYFVNILFWPGLIVDLATGKMWQYDQTDYTFDFTVN
ncbi:MAG: PEGA domain-containing protein [Phycisphaerae bacterium]|nr:PEGA domain-containing protein [Phycisphaerae bacterium]